jgi:hypothetical protein
VNSPTLVQAFSDASAFAGYLGPVPLASVPAERDRIDPYRHRNRDRTGVGAGPARRRRLAGRRRSAQRSSFEIDDLFDAWLHGSCGNPGLTAHWIGPAVEGFTRDNLIETGPHDYVLPEITGGPLA